MDEGNGERAAWSSGLSRSYSEHAALVLQHLENNRNWPESPKCTRSGPNFYSSAKDATDDRGQRTWRLEKNKAESGEQSSKRPPVIEYASGDSKEILAGEFSELSLNQQPQIINCASTDFFSSSSQNTRTTTNSSLERRYNFFQEYGDDGSFELVDVEERETNNSRTQGRSEKEKMFGEVCTDGASSTYTSLTGRQRLNGMPLSRQISYGDWIKEKQRELQRRKDEKRKAEEKRQQKEEQKRREQEERERQYYENFVSWLEKKKQEKCMEQAFDKLQRRMHKRQKDLEDKTKIANSLCVRQWQKKKLEQQKAHEKEELMKQKKIEEEKKKRLQLNVEAYEKWRERSKNTPRPATQGLLPHQKAKPQFTNPTPWQPLLETKSDSSDAEDQPQRSKAPLKGQKSARTIVKK